MAHACVIGSGPSGLTCAHVLIRRGWRVTLLDFGNIPEGASHEQLDPYLTNRNRDDLISVKDLKLKRASRETDVIPSRADFKFNYYYADTPTYVLGKKTNAIANISLAMGGLSNLWGGAVLPATAADIADWPVSLDELRPCYRQIDEFMPLSAMEDSLSRVFQFHAGEPHNFPLGPQAGEFLADLQAGRETLESSGIYFGRAKLAIDPGIPPALKNYTYGAIFNSAVAFKKLMAHEKFKYVPGIFVNEIKESGGRVHIVHVRKSDPAPRTFEADRAFIACGPIATTQILLKSLNLHNQELELKTNQNVYFPFFRYKRQAGISRRETDNIIQLFIDVKSRETDNKFVHFQVYQYGDYVLEPVRRAIGRLTPVFAAAARPFLERIMVMQNMLHSDLSDRVSIRLAKNRNDHSWTVELQGRNNPKTPDACRRVLDLLNAHRSCLRGYALKAVMFIDPPGASNHMGGSFPMSRTPTVSETDPLGRPRGLERTHAVDSTILPSLPATTLTYTVMANAARICNQVQ